MRFVAVLDPTDRWAVVDTAGDVPAEYGGRVLIGLTSREARWFTAAANDDAGYRQVGASHPNPWADLRQVIGRPGKAEANK